MTKNMTLLTRTDVRPDDDEFVTKGYLRHTLMDFKVELKAELKMEFKGEFDELRAMILTALHEIKEIKMGMADMIELIHEKTDPIFKYIEGNEEDKARINRRLAKLESKAGLA